MMIAIPLIMSCHAFNSEKAGRKEWYQNALTGVLSRDHPDLLTSINVITD